LIRFILSLLIVVWFLNKGLGQHIPDLINYKVSEYKAHNQNWSVSQSSDRWMYFANTDGLLCFNGNQWTKNSFDNNKIIRSVHCHRDRVYTGTYGDFGYWIRDACGAHHYTSLLPLVPDRSLNNEEIWHITSDGDDVYFQSFSILMKYDGKSIQKIDLPGSIMFLHIVNNRKIVHALGDGLFEIKSDTYEKLEGSHFFADKTVTGIAALPGNKELLVTTSSHGIFVYDGTQIRIWSSLYQNYFIESQVNKSLITQQNQVTIGTIRDGLLFFDVDGTLKYHFKSTNGLQNNTVLSLMQDIDHHIWLGLDKGIAHIKVNENILYFKDQSGNLGTVYCVLQHNNFLYVGTNQGLYYVETIPNIGGTITTDGFRLVKGTQGQVWELKKVGHSIFCGHNEGTFIIERDLAAKISDVTGGWFLHNLNGEQDTIIQGTYTGLIMFYQLDQGWQFSHKITGFTEPVKKIIQKNRRQFWVTGPNLGVSLLTLDESLHKVVNIYKLGAAEGLRYIQNPDINIHQNRLILFDGIRHYYYDEASKKFKEEKEFNRGDSDYFLRNISEDIWAKIYKDSLIIFNKDKKFKYSISINKDYHSIKLLEDKSLGVSLSEGYAILNFNDETDKSTSKQPIKIHTLQLTHRNHCIAVGTEQIEISYHDNGFKLYFYDTEYLSDKKYWYRIASQQSEWISVNQQDFIAFSNIPPGKHLIEIKNEKQLTSLDLLILPPWYKSNLAYLAYLIFCLFLLWFLKKYFDRQLQTQTQKLNAENERLLREQRIAIENDRLMQENLVKSKELANSTMHLIQKNELLQEIKEELIQIRKSGDQILTTKDFQIMMKQINDNLTVQEDKKLFNESFEDVHHDFFKKLKKEFPELSPDDLKLAAFLRMDLSSKDIAPLFNISIRGLENKRYRLRKKIGLSNDFSLNDYFKNYEE
jgi:hypothetical protein